MSRHGGIRLSVNLWLRKSTYRSFPWVLHDKLAEKYQISRDPPQDLEGKVFIQDGIVYNKRKKDATRGYHRKQSTFVGKWESHWPEWAVCKKEGSGLLSQTKQSIKKKVSFFISFVCQCCTNSHALTIDMQLQFQNRNHAAAVK